MRQFTLRRCASRVPLVPFVLISSSCAADCVDDCRSKLGRCVNIRNAPLQITVVVFLIRRCSFSLAFVGSYGQELFNFGKGQIYCTIIVNISATVAISYLVMLYLATKDVTADYQPGAFATTKNVTFYLLLVVFLLWEPNCAFFASFSSLAPRTVGQKFIAIKLVVFLCFWQGVAITILVKKKTRLRFCFLPFSASELIIRAPRLQFGRTSWAGYRITLGSSRKKNLPEDFRCRAPPFELNVVDTCR